MLRKSSSSRRRLARRSSGASRRIPAACSSTDEDHRRSCARRIASPFSRAARRGTRARRQVHDRAAGPRARGRRLRLEHPLSAPIVGEHARRRHHAVRRNGRHPGGASRGQEEGASSIAICNVVGSMATRRSTAPSTHGSRIGVASTKAFTSQLVALYLLALRLAQVRGVLSAEDWKPA